MGLGIERVWCSILCGEDYACSTRAPACKFGGKLKFPANLAQVSYYDYALDLILDADSPSTEILTDEQHELVESAAETLYGLIHVRCGQCCCIFMSCPRLQPAHARHGGGYGSQRCTSIGDDQVCGKVCFMPCLGTLCRYILTSRGMNAMYEKYKNCEFGRCPRVLCNGQPCLPVGTCDVPRQSTVKIFCPKCQDIYYPRSKYQARSPPALACAPGLRSSPRNPSHDSTPLRHWAHDMLLLSHKCAKRHPCPLFHCYLARGRERLFRSVCMPVTCQSCTCTLQALCPWATPRAARRGCFLPL